MSKIIPEPQTLSIRTDFSLDCLLVDKRYRTEGLVFGTLGDVARQYGIKITQEGYTNIFSAPKSRLQLFAEKLHFARIPFA